MKLDKPLEEEIDLILNEIPIATSAPHHNNPLLMPALLHRGLHLNPPMHAPRHVPQPPQPPPMQMPMPSSSDVSPSSSNSPPSPVDSWVNPRFDELDLDLLARFHAMHLRSDPNPNPYPNGYANQYPNPNPNPNPYPFMYHPLRYSSPELARSVRNLHSFNRNPYHQNPNPLRARMYNSYEDSFILEGRRVNGQIGLHKKRGDGLSWQQLESLAGVEGNIYHIAKDQNGCRLLQKKFDEGRRQDVDLIFNGVIYHVAELMMNPFGNYLMQKLLDVCTEHQRSLIVLELTRDPWEIIRVSLNTHGTRAVQRLIETLNTPQQTGLVVSALKPGFLSLIKDLNGNHVIQRCLQSLSAENNKFIFEAAARHCVDIGTHQHGCCVLQKCINYATGEYQAHLIEEISANGLHLAQDPFGNYVVQFILDKNHPSAMANLALQFKGNYVQLSTQKFSSNVVEKCLKLFGKNDVERIVLELLSVSRFEMLLQDPFANYVVQSALDVTKGSLHAALVKAILPHAVSLRSSPYGKKFYMPQRGPLFRR